MKKGFTLIELLVVIAIISILAALLFPVFAQAKAAAKQTVCMSNLKQIGTAFNLYMNDYDDVFPYAVDASDKFDPQIWSAFPDFEAQIPKMPLMSDALQPYLKSHEVFHCPSDTGLTVLDENFPQTLDGSYSCFKRFGSSYFFRTEIAFRALTSSSFKLPADVNVMFDGTGAWHGSTRLDSSNKPIPLQSSPILFVAIGTTAFLGIFTPNQFLITKCKRHGPSR